HPDAAPAFNEIVPGWMLAENLYALKRTEQKFRSRNRARRARIEFAVLRPDTIDLVRDACRRLEAVRQRQEVYTEDEIGGLGKNLLTERSRQQAVAAYRFAVRYYALLGLKERAEAARAEGRSDLGHGLLATPGPDPRWEHQRQILVHELG